MGVPGQPPGDFSSCGLFAAARLLEVAFDLPHRFEASGVVPLRLALAASIARGSLLPAAIPPFPTDDYALA